MEENHGLFAQKNCLIVLNDGNIEPHFKTNLHMIECLLKLGYCCQILHCPSFVDLQNLITYNPEIIKANQNTLYELTKKSDANSRINYSNLESCQHICMSEIITEHVFYETIEHVQQIKEEEYLEYFYEGINIGKIAAIDLSLSLKATFANLKDPRVKMLASLTIANNIFAIKAVKFLCRPELKSNSTLVLQSSVYSQNICIQKYCFDNFMRHRIYHKASSTTDAVQIITDQQTNICLRRQLMDTKFSHGSIIEYFEFARNQIIYLCGDKVSAHKYSPSNKAFNNLTLEKALNLKTHKKTLTYFTNSPDEEIAIDASHESSYVTKTPFNCNPFGSENEFLLNLKEYMIYNLDVQLIVRLHPRLGKCKRHGFKSFSLEPYLKQIQDIFIELDNVKIIKPDQEIPSYWLGCWSDGILGYRGSMPREMNLFGYQPILANTDNKLINTAISIHSELNPKTKAQWVQALDTIGNSENTEYQLTSFIKDYYYSLMLGSINISNHGDPEMLEAINYALDSGNSLKFFDYKLDDSHKIKRFHLIKYLLWLQDYLYYNVCSNTSAPVFSKINNTLVTIQSQIIR